jgi:hypothetical protein
MATSTPNLPQPPPRRPWNDLVIIKVDARRWTGFPFGISGGEGGWKGRGNPRPVPRMRNRGFCCKYSTYIAQWRENKFKVTHVDCQIEVKRRCACRLPTTWHEPISCRPSKARRSSLHIHQNSGQILKKISLTFCKQNPNMPPASSILGHPNQRGFQCRCRHPEFPAVASSRPLRALIQRSSFSTHHSSFQCPTPKQMSHKPHSSQLTADK